jgi:hypothetical protein
MCASLVTGKAGLVGRILLAPAEASWLRFTETGRIRHWRRPVVRPKVCPRDRAAEATP